MARSAKPVAKAGPKKDETKTAPPAEPDVPRPPQPNRFKADKDQLLQFYREMLLIRRFEERAGQLYGLGLIGIVGKSGTIIPISPSFNEDPN